MTARELLADVQNYLWATTENDSPGATGAVRGLMFRTIYEPLLKIQTVTRQKHHEKTQIM